MWVLLAMVALEGKTVNWGKNYDLSSSFMALSMYSECVGSISAETGVVLAIYLFGCRP